MIKLNSWIQKMTNSKIHKDEVDWVISVYKTSNDEELQNESLDKLLNYGLNETEIDERFKKNKNKFIATIRGFCGPRYEMGPRKSIQ